MAILRLRATRRSRRFRSRVWARRRMLLRSSAFSPVTRLVSLPAPRGPSMAGRRPDESPKAPAVGSSLTPEVLVIPNPVPWPNGAKCAVCFTLDMDAESLLYLAHPQRAHSMVSASSMLRYGPDVAVPRILATYRHYGIRQTFFVPGWCAERYPYALEAMVREGHEVSAHGYLHELPNELSDANEKECLLRSLSAVRSVTGEKSAGWRAPLYQFSHRSAELLLEAGIDLRCLLDGR